MHCSGTELRGQPIGSVKVCKSMTVALTRVSSMTHLLARRDAFQKDAEESISQCNLKACSACGKDFLVVRPWHKQCSPRCRQRTYVQRQSETPMGYCGA